MKSQASGIVQKILVDEGDWVEQGQTLVELGKEELRARLREAAATLAAAEAGEESARAAVGAPQGRAEGPDLPFLNSAIERARKLYEEGSIARSVLEEAEKAYQMALNQPMRALGNLAVARAELARAAGQVRSARAALERGKPSGHLTRHRGDLAGGSDSGGRAQRPRAGNWILAPPSGGSAAVRIAGATRPRPLAIDFGDRLPNPYSQVRSVDGSFGVP
ncbi:MAG: biotin/lipoyl-binding protein [Bryobacterales bacterium]|nr:biotin/lipoyl-binding protein [Bryobacteraceae bacterium]MDW8355580.1 biotin/lipoyl-binding protein [Bryobacterales bacterium]